MHHTKTVALTVYFTYLIFQSQSMHILQTVFADDGDISHVQMNKPTLAVENATTAAEITFVSRVCGVEISVEVDADVGVGLNFA